MFTSRVRHGENVEIKTYRNVLNNKRKTVKWKIEIWIVLFLTNNVESNVESKVHVTFQMPNQLLVCALIAIRI